MMRAAILSLAALGLSACATLDHYEPETAIVPPQAFAGDLPPSGIAENWWEGFGDPVLNGLVEEGLAGNIEIAIAIKIDNRNRPGALTQVGNRPSSLHKTR